MRLEDFFREVPVQTVGHELVRDLGRGRQRCEGDERRPALSLSDQAPHCVARTSVEQHGRLGVAHRELGRRQLEDLAVQEAPCRGPGGTSPGGDEHLQPGREREQPVHELLDGSGLRHEVVVVDDEPGAGGPVGHVLCKELGHRARGAVRRFPDHETLP